MQTSRTNIIGSLKNPKLLGTLVAVFWFAIGTYAFTWPSVGCTPGSCDSPLNVDFTNQRVGIGTTSLTEALEVNGWGKFSDGVDLGYEIVSNSLYKSSWNSSYYVDADCPLGKKVISWGCFGSRASYENNNIYRNYPHSDGASWRCSSYSNTTYDLELIVYAICAKIK